MDTDHHWLFKPGVVQNPLGLNGANTHTRRLEIIRALEGELSTPCDVPGFYHLTKFEYGIKTLVSLWMSGVPWACKELNNRLFGRPQYTVSVGIRPPSVDLSALTTEQLVARARAIADAASIVDGAIVQEGSSPSGDGNPNGRPTLPLPDGSRLDQIEAMVAEDTLPTDPDELRQMIARLEQELAALPEEDQ